ncbi:hypothetical protein Kpol_1042p5 [Vanderwaltozyma polyspora DSM 70294]|uniref:Uncharacterized protein n=1 Tax=Vanderwaltozyma polyspora (strain ATCC 22028 / DSM 70294 / BCRC 21397 / CBS 2163 / NBRC 10782 / NRRL Y-8283 / UCD 57-17) TaxID=436907 RepID=A7TQ94_VANPO|nr:uncharacterized protein Kpol_1042p5 [Vanderwaltozyma polyspora DSM 70294]EDO15548.1 hypothetical protein Kpol_1042p5 [Vanderwaltozyma polyspora DSM 70294]
MLVEAFRDLLDEDGDVCVDNWVKCNLDDCIWFINVVQLKNLGFIFVFLSTDHAPVISKVTNSEITKLCIEQGFEGHTIDVILTSILERIGNSDTLEFKSQEHNIKFSLKITSTIDVQLILENFNMDSKYLFKILNRFNKFLLENSMIAITQIKNLASVINEKDNAIEFLTDRVKDALGDKIIDRWAPPGSVHSKSLRNFHSSNTSLSPYLKADNMKTNSDDITKFLTMKRIFSGIEAKRNLIHRPRSNSNEDSNGNDDFISFKNEDDFCFPADHDELKYLEKPNHELHSISEPDIKLEADEIKSGPIKEELESTTSQDNTELTHSPHKRRKFGKVKVQEG